jgi:hypothetical protein
LAFIFCPALPNIFSQTNATNKATNNMPMRLAGCATLEMLPLIAIATIVITQTIKKAMAGGLKEFLFWAGGMSEIYHIKPL